MFTEPAPVIAPDDVPAATERVLVRAISTVPPVRVEILELPLAVNAPPDIVEMVATPAVTLPPVIAPFNVPVTETVPAEIPLVLVKVALFENAVVPEPDKLVAETVAEVLVKFTLPELVIAPTALVPETLAVAPEATVNRAEEL